jgi:hypothetical protein
MIGDFSQAYNLDRTFVVQQQWGDAGLQKWSFEPLGEGYYRIKAKDTQKYLDVSQYSKEDFAIIWQYSWANVDNQKWLLEHLESNYYKITAKHSKKCLDVYNQWQNQNAYIIQHNWNGGDHQKWRIEKVSEETTNSKIKDAYDYWQAMLNAYNPANNRLTQLI